MIANIYKYLDTSHDKRYFSSCDTIIYRTKFPGIFIIIDNINTVEEFKTKFEFILKNINNPMALGSMSKYLYKYYTIPIRPIEGSKFKNGYFIMYKEGYIPFQTQDMADNGKYAYKNEKTQDTEHVDMIECPVYVKYGDYPLNPDIDRTYIIYKMKRLGSKIENNTYVKLRYGYYPWQTIDMSERLLVRYNSFSDIKIFFEGVNEYLKIIYSVFPEEIKEKKLLGIEYPSVRDLLKMKRTSDKSFKYIYTLDPKTIILLIKVVEMLKAPLPGFNIRFIPVDNLEEVLSGMEVNKRNILLCDLEWYIDVFNKNLSKLVDVRAATHYDTYNIIRSYNLDQIAKPLLDKEHTIRELISATNGITEIKYDAEQQHGNALYEWLDGDYTKFNDKDMSVLKTIPEYKTIYDANLHQTFIKLKIKELLNVSDLKTNKEIYDLCSDTKKPFYFSHSDIQKNTKCKIKDIPEINMDNIRENYDVLVDILNKGITITETEIQKNTDTKNVSLFDYMPELKQRMIMKDYANAFMFRTLFIGNINLTHEITRNCSLLLRADPFVQFRWKLPNISHSMELNKSVIYCQMNKDMIFPMAVIDTNSIRMTSYFNTSDDVLLGTLVITFDNTDKPVVLYVYYSRKGQRPKLTNYRSNFVLGPRRVFDIYNTLWIELQTLYYYDQPLFFYKIKNTSIIVVSKYNIQIIKEKYKQLQYTDNQIDTIINNLIQVQLYKNQDDKSFTFKLINLSGGHNKYNKIKTNYIYLKKYL